MDEQRERRQGEWMRIDKNVIDFLDEMEVDEAVLKRLVVDLIYQLEDSYHAFYQLLSSVPGSFLLFSAEGKVVAASRRMRQKFLENEEIVGLRYDQLQYPFFAESSRDSLITHLIKESVNKGMSFEKVLIEGQNIQQEDVLVELNLNVLRDRDGKILYIMMNLVEDVIRMNLLPGNLEKDQKLKKLGSLAAGLVHEVKNPMQSISAIVQLLQYKYPEDSFLQKYLDSAMTEIHRVHVILGEFLTFSGSNQEYMMYTHINEICEDVLKIVDGNCFMNDIEIIPDLGENIPNMVMDMGRMKQVLVNLITNSIDAINALRYLDDFEACRADYQGRILLKTWYDYDLNECYIQIQDNGIGMTEKTLEAISQPFYTTKRYGTGIGISISKNIIRNHGGRLRIESRYKEGSVFTVILPELAGLKEQLAKKICFEGGEGIMVYRLGEQEAEDYQES